MKTPILGSSYVARSPNAADSRMVNLYPEILLDGGKDAAFLQRCPGLRLLANLGTGPIRGLWVLQSDPSSALVVSGSTLYRLNRNWSAKTVGYIGGAGPVSMADNGRQVFIAAGAYGYIFNTVSNTVTQITSENFQGAGNVAYIDGYFVFNQPGTQIFRITGLLEGSTVDGFDIGSAEGSSDVLVGLIADHRELWLFGTNSVEVWYNSGALDFPFQRVQGAFNELGCAAANSIAKLDNSVFWLGADARGRGMVYRANGYQGQRISTHAVEWQIQQYANLSDAIAFTYQQDGHSFYVLTFPSANATWVYDVSTNAWHERASWRNGEFARHRANCQMSYNGEIVVGDYENGNIYALDLDAYSDHDQPQRWLRSWRALPTGQNDLKRTAHHSLQLDCESGVGLSGDDFTDFYGLLLTENNDTLTTENGVAFQVTTAVAQGANPRVMLRWSDDGGHTWSNEHWAEMGRVGQYGRRVFWRRLGMTLKLRDRVYEISGTDPVKIAVLGAELSISPTGA